MARILASVVLMQIAVTACTPSEPPISLDGPTQIVTATRDILTKGLRGGSNVSPEITRLTYEVTCTTSGGEVNDRAQRAMQTLTQLYPYRDRQIGQSYQSGFEMNGANPKLKDELGCLINRPDLETVTRDQGEIVLFVASNPTLARHIFGIQ